MTVWVPTEITHFLGQTTMKHVPEMKIMIFIQKYTALPKFCCIYVDLLIPYLHVRAPIFVQNLAQCTSIILFEQKGIFLVPYLL
jgi:hypothetical protein